MISINLKANWVPEENKFRVTMNLPMQIAKKLPKHNLEQWMSAAEFLAFARSDGPLIIDGITVKFEGLGNWLTQARDYLRKVADSYENWERGRHTKLLDVGQFGMGKTSHLPADPLNN